MKMRILSLSGVAILTLLIAVGATGLRRQATSNSNAIREVNQVVSADANHVMAIVGATLIDGLGGAPIVDSVVIIRGDKIGAVGKRNAITIPSGAEVIDAKGLSLLPGLIDSHFHIDGDDQLPALFLSHGVTSLRDPGQWIKAYDGARKVSAPIPRLFLCGPHLDSPPPAYPADSFIVRDAEETRLVVSRVVDDGASAIKVYFRLPLSLINVAVETAHARGVPVTAHLEIVDAGDAIRAGVDGIEHATSFGTALMPVRDAEKYRQAVLADNNARRDGRYQIWNTIDLNTPRAKALFKLIVDRGTYVSPTLAVFERQKGDKDTTDVHVRGFRQMENFVRLVHSAGAKVVVGSHSSVPHAKRGWAYQRELELLVESGLTPMQAIVAGTAENARFFRVADRLGTIESGKLADLLIVEGDPSKNISDMRRVKRVMINGRWVPAEAESR
jgi:imidazolonepropionase-like amidohydrolase